MAYYEPPNPNGAPPVVHDADPNAPSTNPWTGETDPNFYQGKYGNFYTGPTGEQVYISNDSHVGEFTDPLSGITYHGVILKNDNNFPDENSSDPTTLNAGNSYNDVHRGIVKPAGNSTVLGIASGGTVGLGTTIATGNPLAGIAAGTATYRAVKGNMDSNAARINAEAAAKAEQARAAAAASGDPRVTVGPAGPGVGGGGPGGTLNTAALSSAISSASSNAGYFANQYKNFTPTVAPTVQATQIAAYTPAQQQAAIQAERIQEAQLRPTAMAGTQAPIQAGMSSAGHAQAGQISSTALAERQAAIQAERVQAAMVQKQGDISAERVNAAQADRTVLGPTALADKEKIAPMVLSDKEKIEAALQAEFRAHQTGLVSGLEGAIAGKDPSVAEIMLRQATERNIANQYALAASANGMNTGLAQRQAMINAADLNQQSIGQQALLRAQEIATARGQLGSVLDQGRGQDISMATSQASLNQGVNLANAGFTNTASMTQAQLNQAVQLANAGFKNTATTTQAQLDAAQKALNVSQANNVNLANAQNALDAAKTNVVLAQQAALANQSAENVARLANAQNALAAATKNAELAQQVAIVNASAINNTNQTNAQLTNATNIANAGYQTQSSIANANNITSANTATAQLANAIAITNANNQSSENIAQGQLTNAARINNAANSLSASQTNATLANAINIANASNSTQRDIAQGGWSNAANLANAANAVTTAGQNITARQDAARNAIDSSGQVIQGTVGMAQAQASAISAAAAARNAQTSADSASWNQWKDIGNAAVPIITSAFGGSSGGGSGGGDDIMPGYTASSDKRVKTDIAGARNDITKLMESLKEVQFKYKRPQAAGAAPGQRFGVLAQDLEKSRAGKSLVKNTSGGKMVDVNQAVMAALAGLGNVNRRLNKIEKRASK